MRRLRKRRVASAVLVVLFLVAVAGAILESQRALEQRELNAAAAELELAAHTLATIELIDSPPANIQLERTAAVRVLEDPAAFDGTGLNAPERQRAQQITMRLTETARQGGLTPRRAIDDLLTILNDDAISADERAEGAASSAFRFLIVAALTGLAIAALVVTGQRRERKLNGILRKHAFTDFLTGLPNRRQISVSLDEARESMEETGRGVAVLFMDLDGFKSVNDNLGHAAGDELLRSVSKRLTAEQRDDELVIRVGGDEFAVVLNSVDTADDALDTARRYQQALERQSIVGDVDKSLRISVGVSFTRDEADLDDLHPRADFAMYTAKREGGSRIALFEEEVRQDAKTRSELVGRLQAADHDSEFRLEFQPVVATNLHEVLFVEALLRWDSPVLGSVSPGDFIPAAEQTGEIKPLGTWVFKQACSQILKWQNNPLMAGIPVSCNVSIHQLKDDDFIEVLSSAISERGIDPWKIIIEVTESSLSGPQVSRRLHEIRTLGYRVAIDDFGSGYANLAQLIHIPFDILKIDSALVRSLEEFGSEKQEAVDILRAINAIAQSRNAPVVCEGIEHEEQRQALVKSEISHLQGWLVSRALRPEDLDTAIAKITGFETLEIDAAA